MDIQFINKEEWGIDHQVFQDCIKRAQNEIPETKGILNVVFVDDSYIHSLNRQYRNKNKPTDVLSFSYLNTPDFKNDMDLIGEIYISIPTAKIQAEIANWPFSSELNKLFVHGLLHIFGYDHETDEDYAEMKMLEDKILS